MATLRQMIVCVLATLLAGLSVAAQPIIADAPGWVPLQVDAFDVEQVPQLTPGSQLNFSLYGTPGAEATVQIDGARREMGLQEVEPGIYEGIYTIDAQDRIAPDGRVTATLRRGDRVASTVLAESLQLGGVTTTASASPLPPVTERADNNPPPRVGRPVPPAPIGSAMPPRQEQPVPQWQSACTDCAVVESIRAVDAGGGRGYVGAITGGLVGAILGDQFGRGDGRRFARILGALGGALAGREIERGGLRRTRFEVVLRLPNGTAQTRSYESAPPFKVGDTVRLRAYSMVRAQPSVSPY